MGPVGGMARLGEIPLNAYYPYKNNFRFIWGGELARSVGSWYKATEISATGPDRSTPHQPIVPIWTAHPTYRDEKLPCLLCLHFARFGFIRSNIRAPVITWQNTSQRPGQNFPMWTREKIRPTYRAGPPPYEQGLKASLKYREQRFIYSSTRILRTVDAGFMYGTCTVCARFMHC